MAVLDSSIVNVAMPGMSGTLGVTIDEITWVVTAYIVLVSALFVIGFPLVFLLRRGSPSGDVEIAID